MSESVTYSVPAIHCAHCAMSIREEVSEVEGVEAVDVDLVVRGDSLYDDAVLSAISDAWYYAALARLTQRPPSARRGSTSPSRA